MVANYFTLFHLTKSLSARLSGLTLRASFSQQRGTLVLHASGTGHEEWIEISCDPAVNYVLPRPSFARARKNSVDVFPELNGFVITDVVIHPSDRQLSVTLESDERIVIQLYGASANVHWVSPSRLIRASFLKAKVFGGTPLLEVERRPLAPPETVDDLRAHDDGGPLRLVLRAAFPQLGPVYIREALFRAGFAGEEIIAGLSGTRQRALVDAVRSVLDELFHRPSARLYERPEEGPLLSLCRLDHLGEIEVRTAASLEEALAQRLARQYRSKELHEAKSALLAQLDRMIRRSEQTLTKVADEASKASRSDEYERFGSLVMANLGRLTKGMRELECEDMFDPSTATVRIPLERSLSPIQNAERYFTKAKKARTAAEDASLRRSALEKDLRNARALRSALETTESLDELRTCVADHRNQLKKMGVSMPGGPSKTAPERVPFRVFTVQGGFAVWAGKSSADNDLLTMKHARPNDLWFHARGAGGSHVVLRSGTGKGEISKRAIEEAASIAAYYSKMKNASTVPVAMTQRKYIRKPKGAPAGTVMIEREKVLFVEPRLPEHLDAERDD